LLYLAVCVLCTLNLNLNLVHEVPEAMFVAVDTSLSLSLSIVPPSAQHIQHALCAVSVPYLYDMHSLSLSPSPRWVK
jgi:hypothetical protein